MAILLQDACRLLVQAGDLLLEQAHRQHTKRRIVVKPHNRTSSLSAENRTIVIQPERRN